MGQAEKLPVPFSVSASGGKAEERIGGMPKSGAVSQKQRLPMIARGMVTMKMISIPMQEYL